MFCFLVRCLEYGLHDGHKNVVCDNYLILSELSMERIDGDEERLDEETFVCETNLQAEEGRYSGEERDVR